MQLGPLNNEAPTKDEQAIIDENFSEQASVDGCSKVAGGIFKALLVFVGLMIFVHVLSMI